MTLGADVAAAAPLVPEVSLPPRVAPTLALRSLAGLALVDLPLLRLITCADVALVLLVLILVLIACLLA